VRQHFDVFAVCKYSGCHRGMNDRKARELRTRPQLLVESAPEATQLQIASPEANIRSLRFGERSSRQCIPSG
jgi:hypothetical protein